MRCGLEWQHAGKRPAVSLLATPSPLRVLLPPLSPRSCPFAFKLPLALPPIHPSLRPAVMGAVFEKKHLDSMAETEAREAAERAVGHTPPPRVTASGGVTSHGVEIDPENPLNKILPDTDCEYCLETRQKM